jgi:hypothetical protein
MARSANIFVYPWGRMSSKQEGSDTLDQPLTIGGSAASYPEVGYAFGAGVKIKLQPTSLPKPDTVFTHPV